MVLDKYVIGTNLTFDKSFRWVGDNILLNKYQCHKHKAREVNISNITNLYKKNRFMYSSLTKECVIKLALHRKSLILIIDIYRDMNI